MPVDQIESRVELALRSAFANLESYLRDIIKELNTSDGKLDAADAFNIARLDNTLRNIRGQMDALGYREVVLQELAGLEQLHYEILEKAEAMDLPPEFSRESQQAITILMQGAEQELLMIAQQASDEIGQLLRRSVLGGGNVGDLLIQISDKLAIRRNQAMTLVTTSLHSFNSMITVRHAVENEIKWFRYAGPNELSGAGSWKPGHVIREWCWHWHGRRGTIEMFEDTAGMWGRDESLTPVTTWRGTWNCRHRLIPIDDEEAKKYPIGPK